MKSVVLITGVSSGIGKATAKLLYSKGYVIYGTSRHYPEKLVEKDKNFFQVQLDVNDSQSVQKCVQNIIDKEKQLDIIINNAGFGYVSPLMFGTVEQAKNQFETNFFGAIRVIEQVLPQMISQKNGKIINIGSIAGRIAIPYQGLYSASKSALASYSDALRMECKKYNIGVSLIEPGDTSTEFDTRRVIVEAPEPIQEEMLTALNIMRKAEHDGRNPEKVAKLIYKAIKSKRPKSRYTSGIDAKLVNYGTRLFPKGLVDKLITSNYKVSGKKI